MASAVAPDLAATVEAVQQADSVLLVGVRHHSPLLAAALPALFDAWRPSHVLVELPGDFARWLGPLGDPRLQAPVALSADSADGRLSFYPFADFSPELAALRWAATRHVPAVAIDLPLPLWAADRPGPTPGWSLREALEQRGELAADEDLWDRLVEAPGAGADPEALRRAALAVGAALRLETELTGTVDEVDRGREQWMAAQVRACVDAGGRPAVVVGAFHAPALLDREPAELPPAPEPTPTALLAYEFELLDSRSGYPSGVLDPAWQQLVWACGGVPARLRDAAAELSVAATGHLRGQGHASGVPDATEVLRMACDLAALRGLPAPGRQELVESFSSCCAQGDVLGRGRAVAKALQATFVGRRRGVLAPGSGRAALTDDVRSSLTALRLPVEDEPGQRFRLETSRSSLDARRAVVLHRLDVLGVPYGRQGDAAPYAVGVPWELHWSRSTTAVLELRSAHGATLAAAAAGALRSRWLRGDRDLPGCLSLLADARRCQFREAADLAVSQVPPLVTEAAFAAQVDAVEELSAYADELSTTDVVAAEHVRRVARDVLEHAFGSIAGMGGSTDLHAARALVTLSVRTAAVEELSLRLRHELTQLAGHASPLVEGALVVVELVLGLVAGPLLARRVDGWVVAAGDPEARRVLVGRLTGLLATGLEVVEGSDVLEALLASVNALGDRDLLDRLPALRAGFDAVSPAGRARLLEQLASSLDTTTSELSTLTADPALLAGWCGADLAARAAVAALGSGEADPSSAERSVVEAPA